MKNELKELFILHFLNDATRTTIIVLLPFIAKDLSLSLTQAGFLGSAQPLIAALLAIPTGFIIGKLGGLRVIFSILLIYSLSVFGIAFAFNPPLLFTLYFIAAIGFGMFHTVGFTLTAKSSSSENVGRNMANFTSIGEIGRVSLPPLAVFAVSLVGWRMVIGALGLVGIIIFIITRFIRTTKDTHTITIASQEQTHTDFIKDIVSLFTNKQAVYVTITAIIDGLASSPIYVYLPFLLLSKGLSAALLSVAMGAFFVGSLVGKTILGSGVDKLGNVKVFIGSELLMALSLILITLNSNFLFLLFFAFLLGGFTKGTSPVIQTMFSELSHKDHYHKVFAVSELVIGLAAVITIISMGGLADKTNISYVFYVASGLAVLATIPLLLHRKTANP